MNHNSFYITDEEDVDGEVPWILAADELHVVIQSKGEEGTRAHLVLVYDLPFAKMLHPEVPTPISDLVRSRR